MFGNGFNSMQQFDCSSCASNFLLMKVTHLCFTYLALPAVLQFNQEFLARAHFNVGLVGQSSLNISKNEFYLLVGVVRPAAG